MCSALGAGVVDYTVTVTNVFTKIINRPKTESSKLFRLFFLYIRIKKKCIASYNAKPFEISKAGVTMATNELNRIFLKATNEDGMQKINKNKTKNKMEDKWFDNECKHSRTRDISQI